MSPELCDGDGTYSYASDVWAVGCVLYEMCTLHFPFVAKTTPALVKKICTGDYTPLDRKYSPHLRQLQDDLLAVNPTHRPTVQHILTSAFLRPALECYVSDVVKCGSSKHHADELRTQLHELRLDAVWSHVHDQLKPARQSSHPSGTVTSIIPPNPLIPAHNYKLEDDMLQWLENERQRHLVLVLGRIKEARCSNNLSPRQQRILDHTNHVPLDSLLPSRPSYVPKIPESVKSRAMREKTRAGTDIPMHVTPLRRCSLQAQQKNRDVASDAEEMTALLLRLDLDNVSALHALEGGSQRMSQDEFLATVVANIHGTSTVSMEATVTQLCHLFHKIDHDEDGVITWTEFTSFVLESMRGYSEQLLVDGLHEIRAWNCDTLECMGTVNLKTKHSVTDMTFLSPRANAVVASLAPTISIMDISSNKQLHQLVGHRLGVTCVKYSLAYRYIISAGLDHDVRVRASSNMEAPSRCTAMVYLPDLNRIVLASSRVDFHDAVLWNASDENALDVHPPHDYFVPHPTKAMYSDYALDCLKRIFAVYDPDKTGETAFSHAAPLFDAVVKLNHRPCQRNESYLAKLLLASSKSPATTLTFVDFLLVRFRSDIGCVAVSHQYNVIVTASMDGHFCVWHGSKCEPLASSSRPIGEHTGITAIVFLEPHPIFAIANDHGGLELYAIPPHPLRYDCLFRTASPATIHNIAWCLPRTLVTGDEEGTFVGPLASVQACIQHSSRQRRMLAHRRAL
ncbi:hypothetical protein DYB32_006642 [Aphanomyces invadans]|uniref:non-specific serine/threonine protein kinase n=1 Tax=Aphanomyces invadans TaxID=157072 RepID=A0A418AR42_9STRA|nr:hypothetical protein DYB32_006642 [Aphanomyces invadans]